MSVLFKAPQLLHLQVHSLSFTYLVEMIKEMQKSIIPTTRSPSRD
jgi:hypothetical protein